MHTVWRLQTLTGDAKKNERHIGQYCLKNKVAAMGWSLYLQEGGQWTVSQEEREAIGDDFSKYEKACETHNQYLRSLGDKLKNKDSIYKSIDNVKRLLEVKAGDLIWMRDAGIYYVGRVGENPKWSFVADQHATEKDACNQLGPIDWKKVGDESEVPGAIITAFIGYRTFQRIQSEGAGFFSGSNYDRIAGTRHYAGSRRPKNQEAFFDLLSPGDAEDLLCLWLFRKYGYVCIPSTNKSSTQLYECVLLDTADGSKVFVQVKKGDSEKAVIDVSDYKALSKEGKVYLLQTKGECKRRDFVRGSTTIADPAELYDFALNNENRNYLFPAIIKWVEFLSTAAE